MRDREIDQRVRRGDVSRQRIVEAVLAFVEEGTFRPTLRQVAARAGMPSTSILKHYRSLEELNKIVAKKHAAAVANAAGLYPRDLARVVWIILVGKLPE